jgi:DNA polymerase-3 subunit epsilon
MLKKLFDKFDHIIFIDVETSGLNSKLDEIIEIGGIRTILKNGKVCIDKELNILIRLSEHKIVSQKIVALTGITAKMLDENGLDKSMAGENLVDLLNVDRPLIIAYNAQFDLCFMYYFLHSLGKENILHKIKMLDALTVYKDRRDYPHKLENAIQAYNIDIKNTHRAIDDARATFELLLAMDKEMSDLEQYINLFGFNPRYGINGPKISSIQYLPQSYARDKKLYADVEQIK